MVKYYFLSKQTETEMVKQAKDEALWDATQLAAYLGYSVATVRAYMSAKPDSLPPRAPTTGGGVRWSPAVVHEWVRQLPPQPSESKPGRPRRQIKPPRQRAVPRSKL